jgi:hypothetical protein
LSSFFAAELSSADGCYAVIKPGLFRQSTQLDRARLDCDFRKLDYKRFAVELTLGIGMIGITSKFLISIKGVSAYMSALSLSEAFLSAKMSFRANTVPL